MKRILKKVKRGLDLDTKKNNYIEHEISVTLMDSILSQKQGYQWFVDYIEDNFDDIDIGTWNDFDNHVYIIKKLVYYFDKIFQTDIQELNTRSLGFKDKLLVSRYNNTIISLEECSKNLNTKLGKLLLLISYTSKLLEIDNDLEDGLNVGILTINNFWQKYNLASVIENKEKVLVLFDNIELKDSKVQRDILLANIEQVEIPFSENFISLLSDAVLNAETFSYQNFNLGIRTNIWQELVVLNMVKQPLDSFEKSKAVSISLIDMNNLNTYFKDEPPIRFIIETICYIMFNQLPSSNVVDQHYQLILDFKSDENAFKLFHSSSMMFLSKLYKTRDYKKNDGSDNSIKANFLAAIHDFKDAKQIEYLKSLGLPLNKIQTDFLKEYTRNLYKSIDEVANEPDLLSYLENISIVTYLNNEYFDKIRSKFRTIVLSEVNKVTIDSASMFLAYMKFLYKIINNGEELSKQLVAHEVIEIQDFWEKTYYKKELSNLKEFKYGIEIPNNVVEDVNRIAKHNPFIVAKRCVLPEENDILKVMERASENPLIYMFRVVNIDSVFPNDTQTEVDIIRHDIDGMLSKEIDRIKKEKGYKFRNSLETNKFLKALHEEYIQNASFIISLITNIEELYDEVKNNFKNELIDFDSDIKLAHITQLFPILERAIRKLAKLTGFNPFKMKLEEFMKYKDPSSILREIIEEIYGATGGFDNIPDLMFIYHFMYNSNSLNIRNECIHGRDYLVGERLKFAIKITLLSILMINNRIKMIEQNMEVN